MQQKHAHSNLTSEPSQCKSAHYVAGGSPSSQQDWKDNS